MLRAKPQLLELYIYSQVPAPPWERTDGVCTDKTPIDSAPPSILPYTDEKESWEYFNQLQFQATPAGNSVLGFCKFTATHTHKLKMLKLQQYF